ncbi:MAG: glycoside hydrolase family 2 TIM barrel-domain containing protein [Planctomycetota bacterium]
MSFNPLIIVSVCLGLFAATAWSGETRLEKRGDGYRLLVDGQPFYVKGAGGDASKTALVEAGGNAFRTWGIGPQTKTQLDEAHRLGLKVSVGIWLGHGRHGFDYNDPEQVRAQFEAAEKAVREFKDHPAILVWCVGNEMEVGLEGAAREKMWEAVNDIGMMIKRIDPHHPTMTVTADLGGDSVEAIRDRCPGIDIHGINSYGGAASIPQRYAAAGGTKPYMVAEFGPLGIWEIGKNDLGTYDEKTSTDKAAIYREVYANLLADQELCLGSFAFAWGDKQEVTATWFGMFLPDGSRLASVDVMTEMWTGEPPANRCPRIESIALQTQRVEPGGTVQAVVELLDPEGDPLEVEWLLVAEGKEFKTGGDAEEVPDSFPDAVIAGSDRGALIQLPGDEGLYRVFVYVRDGHGGAATANVPLQVGEAGGAPSVGRWDVMNRNDVLPLSVYPVEADTPPYFPSGYMGSTDAIQINESSPVDPHSGTACIEARFTATNGWGGVVWQHPAEDWGDQPGGHDLTGAAELSFWARGANGGEKVKFGFGILKDKAEAPHPDSSGAEREIVLNPQWQRHAFDLAGKDLSQIKTGFYWVLASAGSPVTFYLDDIRYAAAEASPETSETPETPAPAAPSPPTGLAVEPE